MLLEKLAANIVGNSLTGRGLLRASERVIRAGENV